VAEKLFIVRQLACPEPCRDQRWRGIGSCSSHLLWGLGSGPKGLLPKGWRPHTRARHGETAAWSPGRPIGASSGAEKTPPGRGGGPQWAQSGQMTAIACHGGRRGRSLSCFHQLPEDDRSPGHAFPNEMAVVACPRRASVLQE